MTLNVSSFNKWYRVQQISKRFLSRSTSIYLLLRYFSYESKKIFKKEHNFKIFRKKLMKTNFNHQCHCHLHYLAQNSVVCHHKPLLIAQNCCEFVSCKNWTEFLLSTVYQILPLHCTLHCTVQIMLYRGLLH